MTIPKPSARPTVPTTLGHSAAPIPNRERLIPAVDAVKQILGRAPHVSTVHRWTLRGVLCDGKRIYLEAYRIGGRLCCSLQAVERFVDATAARRSIELPTPPRSDAKCADALAKANASLAKSGI